VEETKEHSRVYNPDHLQDRVEVTLKVLLSSKWYGRGWDRPKTVDLTFRHELSWYSSDKDIELDSRHVGRKDTQRIYEVELQYPWIGGASLQIGYKHARRKVDSPYEGEIIADEKDYVSDRFWIGVESDF